MNNKNVKNNWQYDPFFQQPVHTIKISTGDAHLPVKYFDASSLVASFMVDYDKAASLVTCPDVKVVKLEGNKALFTLAFYEYRSLTDNEPYHEVGSSVLVYPANQPAPQHPLDEVKLPPDQRNIGIWVYDLPVTTDQACIAGKEMWGYPKFVTPINFKLDDKGFKGSVEAPNDKNKSIVTLEGTFTTLNDTPWNNLVLYSTLDGDLIRATANTRAFKGAKGSTDSKFKVTVDSTVNHPMAERLTKLGINDAVPVSIIFTDSLQLRLNEGVVY